MKKLEGLQSFYESRYKWIPNELRNNLGHFNVFPLESPAIGEGAKPLEYGRREWFNIVLVFGGGIFHCLGKQYKVSNHAIAFTNPFTPFGWDQRNLISKGYFCIFNELFVSRDKKIMDFIPFKTNTIPFYELSENEAQRAESHFQRMFEEIKSDYIHKYDIIILLIQELLHLTMKSDSFNLTNIKTQSAAERITIKFLELLEHQFPIEDSLQTLQLLTPADFARKLHIHVNHLNKSVKATTEKTTSQIIKERIGQEAKTLIKYTNWNFSEIAFSLGFKEATHFNNFFKKTIHLTPTQYRKLR